MSNDNYRLKITSFASSLAGIIGRLICHPVDTIRAKLQIKIQFTTFNSLKQNILIETVRDTFRHEGIRGFFQGAGISVLGAGPAFSLYLTSYEWAKQTYNKNDVIYNHNLFKIFLSQYLSKHQNIQYFISGLTAEAISCLLWLPIDVVKERLQVQKNLKFYNYKNSIDAILQILKGEGIIGLYRAYGATLASFGPFSAFYFVFYEKFKQLICENPKDPKFLESMILSGLAGSLSGFLVNPMEIAKLRMQVQRAGKAHGVEANQLFGYRNLLHGMYCIVKSEGVLSLTKGAYAKILYAAPNTAITMSLAEVLRSYMLRISGYEY